MTSRLSVFDFDAQIGLDMLILAWTAMLIVMDT